jgi:hypothetical protein
MGLIAVYAPEEFDTKSTIFFAKQQPVLHMNVHLIHDDEPKGALMSAGGKYAKGVGMIHEELWRKEDEQHC